MHIDDIIFRIETDIDWFKDSDLKDEISKYISYDDCSQLLSEHECPSEYDKALAQLLERVRDEHAQS